MSPYEVKAAARSAKWCALGWMLAALEAVPLLVLLLETR